MTKVNDYGTVILDTIETFLESAPVLENNNAELSFGVQSPGARPNSHQLNIEIDGQLYTVTVDQVG